MLLLTLMIISNVGGLNFFAVADAVKVSPSALATGLAVDNLLGLLYFPFISWCGAPYDENRINGVNDNMGNSVMKSVFLYEGSVLSENIPSVSTEHSITHTNQVPSTMVTTASISSGTAKKGEEKERRNDEVENGQENIQELPSHSSIITPSSIDIIQHDIGNNQDLNTMDEVEKLSSALALAFTIAFIADMLSQKFLLPSIPISTLLTVIMATTFPKKLKMMIPSGELLGKLFLLFFFASVGNASGTIGSTFAAKGAASLLLYECILYIVHISFIIGVGRNILNIPMPDILLASNANIGNAATASSLATARGWKNRILPSILVGTLGNAFGTFAGLSLGSFCLKKIAGY